MQQLLNFDQTGFLEGRFIEDNIRHLVEIIEYHDNNNLPGLVFVSVFATLYFQ